jgi:hypothetical protein
MFLTQLMSLFATAPSSCGGGFFGLIPWYNYLPNADFANSPQPGCNISAFTILSGNGQTSDVPYVLLAVVDDLLRVAGLVAVGFIIYGAFQYVGSQGNPEQTAKAQSTIINALIGLAIAVTAVVFVSFLGSQLGGQS